MLLFYVWDLGVYILFGKLIKKIVGNVVKDIFFNYGINGMKVKNLGKRVYYINWMIFKEILEDIFLDDFKKDIK